jgi:membrane fusion protein (multidrug efflux system)
LEGTPVRLSPFNLPEAIMSKQKFERRVPGGTPPPSTADTSSNPTQKK